MDRRRAAHPRWRRKPCLRSEARGPAPADLGASLQTGSRQRSRMQHRSLRPERREPLLEPRIDGRGGAVPRAAGPCRARCLLPARQLPLGGGTAQRPGAGCDIKNPGPRANAHDIQRGVRNRPGDLVCGRLVDGGKVVAHLRVVRSGHRVRHLFAASITRWAVVPLLHTLSARPEGPAAAIFPRSPTRNCV